MRPVLGPEACYGICPPMNAEPLRTGGEVDAFCTSCKADRRHRIIAIDPKDAKKAKKVECLSCKGHHNFRQTEAQKAAAAAHKRASRSEVTSPRLGKSASAPKRREEDLAIIWEKAITGKPFDLFKPYRITIPLSKGELIRHAKFGEGVVAEVLDPNKCEILFKDGLKTLAHSIAVS